MSLVAPWLWERMATWSDEPALVWEGRTTSYGALLDQVRVWETELDAAGLGPGSVVAIDGGFSPAAVSLLLALVRRRAVAVPLTPVVRVHREAFMDVAEAQALFELDATDGWTLTRRGRSPSNPLTVGLIGRGHPGLVIFSSGTTGAAKAVLHDLAALLGKFEKPRQKKTTLTFLLFDHIGGLDTLFNTLSSGGAVVTTPNREPDTVCAAIARHGVHTLPTSPTFLNLMLISEAWRAHDLSSLAVIAYGTELMPEGTLARLREAFPHVNLVQTYGSSELGVLRTKSRDSASLWLEFHNEGFETEVRDGVLWVRAQTAMLGYLNAPALFDADGWFNTQDAVVVEGSRMRILGRASDLINVGGQKVYPSEVEEVLLQMDNVKDVSAFAKASPLVGHYVAIRVNLIAPEPLVEFKRRMREFCRPRLANYKIPVHVELTDAAQFGARYKKTRHG